MEGQFEIEVVWASPYQVQIYFESANHLFLYVEGLDFQKLLPQLVLVGREIKRLIQFPLNISTLHIPSAAGPLPSPRTPPYALLQF